MPQMMSLALVPLASVPAANSTTTRCSGSRTSFHRRQYLQHPRGRKRPNEGKRSRRRRPTPACRPHQNLGCSTRLKTAHAMCRRRPSSRRGSGDDFGVLNEVTAGLSSSVSSANGGSSAGCAGVTGCASADGSERQQAWADLTDTGDDEPLPGSGPPTAPPGVQAMLHSEAGLLGGNGAGNLPRSPSQRARKTKRRPKKNTEEHAHAKIEADGGCTEAKSDNRMLQVGPQWMKMRLGPLPREEDEEEAVEEAIVEDVAEPAKAAVKTASEAIAELVSSVSSANGPSSPDGHRRQRAWADLTDSDDEPFPGFRPATLSPALAAILHSEVGRFGRRGSAGGATSRQMRTQQPASPQRMATRDEAHAGVADVQQPQSPRHCRPGRAAAASSAGATKGGICSAGGRGGSRRTVGSPGGSRLSSGPGASDDRGIANVKGSIAASTDADGWDTVQTRRGGARAGRA